MSRGMTPFGLQVRGVNGSASVEVYVAQDFSLADIPLHKVEFLVGGRELASEAAGVLGENVLGLLDVEYDFANGVIRLFKPENCGEANLAYWSAGKALSVLPIERPETPLKRFILAKASVNGQPIRVEFDSGAGRSVLTRQAAERAGIHLNSEDVEAGGLSYGFGRRALETWISPVSNFTIGGEQIQNTRLRVGNIELDHEDMLLGADFFLSHRIYVSNSQHRVYFTYNGGPVFRLDQARQVALAKDAPQGGAGVATGPASEGAAKADAAPADAAGFARRGSALAARRDFSAAIADFSRAIELEPQVAQHYYDRALARLAARQPVLAMSDLDQGLKLKPDDPRGLEIRGELYLAGGDIPLGRKDFEAALKAAPQDAELGLRVAGAYERHDLFEPAIAQYDAWIAAHPKTDRTAQALNGRCWARALWNKELDKALADCNAALKQGLTNSNVLDSRGLTHLRLGQFEAAIADYDASLKLQPRSAWSLYGRGLAKRKKGDAAGAEADIKAALAIQPNLINAVRRYGLAVEAAAGAPEAGSRP